MAAITWPGEVIPALTSAWPTSRITATTTYISAFMTGFMKAKIVSTFSWVLISSSLALPKRSFS